MITFVNVFLIGAVSGVLLAIVMKGIRLVTGNKADILLYNMDYIPIIKQWSEYKITGIIFHYATCIGSAVVLFYLLIPFGLNLNVWPYVFVFTVGGGILYFLSMLTEKPPSYKDRAAWFYWTLSHAIFGIAVGFLISVWIG